MTHRSAAVVLLLALAVLTLIPALLSAQSTGTTFGTSMTLSASPEYPTPNSSVQIKAASVFLNLNTSVITWYVNGRVVQSDIGATQFQITAGELGSETRIYVEAQGGNASAIAQGVVRPTEVDLLWEGDSYVPPFYRGRALPTSGSSIRLFAIPRLVPGGSSTPIPAEDLIYTWRQGGQILQGASGRGRYTATIEASPFSQTESVSVEVKTTDGELRGFASARIPSTDPKLVLYEDHPAFGILFHQALINGSTISESEASFSVIPYFAPEPTLKSSLLQYAWRVNGTPLTNDPTRPNTITLNAEGTDGNALIELAFTHATNYFISARNSWNLTLSTLGGNVFTDPFRGNQ